MMKKIFRKFKSRRAESISEVLVAMLVVALGSVMFASMVMASQRIINGTQENYKQYIASHNALEEMDSNSPDVTRIEGQLKISEVSGSQNDCAIGGNARESVTVYVSKDKNHFTYQYQ